MKLFFKSILLCVLLWAIQSLAAPITFVFTSDPHYGVYKESFRGAQQVSASSVNQAMLATVPILAKSNFPSDGGVGAGQLIGAPSFLVQGGDIANRQDAEENIQSASISWSQFAHDYLQSSFPVYMIPGNHDLDNALGSHKHLKPDVDAGAYLGIYNAMMNPATPVDAAHFDYLHQPIQFAHDIGGVHMEFVTLWPDARARRWMATDLAKVKTGTPVLLFAHADIEPEDKFFTTEKSQKHNWLPQLEGSLNDTPQLDQFLVTHPQIKAYFHGHTHCTKFRTYQGTTALHLPVFGVDSPMKGDISANDESKLSYLVITLDSAAGRMTVRECFWNVGKRAGSPLQWGESQTIPLR